MRWLLILCVACGGSAASDGETPAARSGSAKAEAEPDKGATLSEADCVALTDHMLDVALDEKRTTAKPEEVPTDEQVAAIRAQMRGEIGERCVGKERGHYDCMMQAKTRAEMEACEGG